MLPLAFVSISEFRFTSEVPIWLDYHGKHVVIEQVFYTQFQVFTLTIPSIEIILTVIIFCFHREPLQGF